jgi:exodeoxyribonuclease VII large subunit
MADAMRPSSGDAPIGVGELDRRLRMLLERRTDGVWVHGEVSQVREVGSGHVYFVLCDEEEEAAIDCVLYRTAPVRSRRAIVSGARVVVQGRATVYAPRGRLQLTVDRAEPAGEGALLVALAALRKKLEAEGLFDAARKRPLPREPRTVGVVTSADGAAFHDVVKVAFRRAGVRIVLVRAAVQGARAPDAIARALALVGRHPGVDAVILTRGGGSVEDLSAFQDEAVVRAIAACAVPVVSAVGHEVDVTLSDLVADARAATPSQAAELLVPDDRARDAMLRQLRVRLARAARHELGRRQQDLDERATRARTAIDRSRHARWIAASTLERRLAARHPRAVLAASRARLDRLDRALRLAMPDHLASARRAVDARDAALEPAVRRALDRGREALGRAAPRLGALSPLAVLARGYAIALDARGRAIVDALAVAPGEALRVRLASGEIAATVVSSSRDLPTPEEST